MDHDRSTPLMLNGIILRQLYSFVFYKNFRKTTFGGAVRLFYWGAPGHYLAKNITSNTFQ